MVRLKMDQAMQCNGIRGISDYDTSCGAREVEMNVQKISAFTLKVGSMQASVGFYRDLLGMKLVYGGEEECFSSLCTSHSNGPILNLEQGNPVAHWGRLIFYVSDVDAFCAYLKEKELRPGAPQDASWGERYFHMSDPDGHALSFAHPL
jgi:catechol 2,3-dioxygenase-like lactoylglutathione lyase family enzyme